MVNVSRFRVLLLLALSGTIVLPVSGQDAVPGAAPPPVDLYEPLTFTINIDPATYTNPFDAGDIELVGVFTSPAGRERVIPGFWMQPYDRDVVEPVGDPLWQVRFTPDRAGTWDYSLQVRDNGTLIAVDEGQFEVLPSARSGFIGVGGNGRYFEYDNGQAYFPIGHNLKWSWEGGGGLETYFQWLRDLSAAGGNYARLFIDVPWFIGLEWHGRAGDYRADQDSAARLDAILRVAAEEGVALQLVLLWHQSMRTFNGPPVLIPEDPPRPGVSADWDDHPYNALNGGPLSGPGVFLFDETARGLFVRRLRYIVARWGYSPQIFAWEIVDEIDRIANFSADVADEWLFDMVSILRDLDQQRHLITAGSREFNPVTAANPLLDFTVQSFYQRRPIEEAGDQVAGTLRGVRRNLQANPLPTLLTAYSLNPWFEPVEDDPAGVHFQNTLWASALSGAAGAGASDWWHTYVIPQDLPRHYSALASFVTGIDWGELDLQPVEAGLLSEDTQAYAPVRVENFSRRFLAPPREVVETHTITPDGVFPDADVLPSYLYGQVFNNRLSQAQHYRVTLPLDTYLEIEIRAVSDQAAAKLIVSVDGTNRAELTLGRGNRNVTVRLPLSAGEHRLMLDNLGDDWLELSYIEIGKFRTAGRALTLRDAAAGVALAWIQHRDYTWTQVAAGETPEAVNFSYRLEGMQPGRYAVEIWGPLTGGPLGQEIVRVRDDGLLRVSLPPLENQLALRVFRQPDPVTATPPPSDTPPVTATVTPSPSPTRTATATPTASPSPTSTATATPTRTATASPLPTRTATATPTPAATAAPARPRVPSPPATGPAANLPLRGLSLTGVPLATNTPPAAGSPPPK